MRMLFNTWLDSRKPLAMADVAQVGLQGLVFFHARKIGSRIQTEPRQNDYELPIPDAFRQGGLGRSAFEVLRALEAGGLRARELAQRTGRHVQTIRKSLKRLHEFGYTKKLQGSGMVYLLRKLTFLN